MTQPYLSNNEWTYTSVDGLVWLNSGLKLPTNLEERACQALVKIYKEVNVEMPLIIDFRNIKDVADRAMDNMFRVFFDSSREIVLINFDSISVQIDKVIHQVFTKPTKSFILKNDQHCKLLNQSTVKEEDYSTHVNELRALKVRHFVKQCFIPFDEPKYLSSTPIKASGVFDASLIVSTPTPFYWICLELSELLKTLLKTRQIKLSKELRLLSVNLKSSPFASVVSLLNNIPLVTIDHMGPKHKVYDLDILDGLKNLKQYNFIYVGDFCIGGTEIKIAKTYAGISNSELNTAIVVGSLFEGEIFKGSFDLFSLTNLNGLHSAANFSI